MAGDKRHTPKGYRIEGEIKFMLLPTGQEIAGDATACEMELWEIRDKLLEALKGLVRVVGGTLQGYGILEAPMKAAEAAIQSAAEPGSKADHAVRARWERLGLDPSTAPTVFASDVENAVEEELRGLRDGAGRAVVQYSDPAL